MPLLSHFAHSVFCLQNGGFDSQLKGSHFFRRTKSEELAP
jgi:hypothetical protein